MLADCDKLPPPVLPFHNVSFSYTGNAEGLLYKDLEFGIDCDSRIGESTQQHSSRSSAGSCTVPCFMSGVLVIAGLALVS